jgi:hypothetical protein
MTCPKYKCQAAYNALQAIPCLNCPVCRENAQLQAAICHECPNSLLANIYVRPGKTCELCAFCPGIVCKCDVCNVIGGTGHAQSFALIANSVPPVVPTGRTTWPDLPMNDAVDNVYATKKRCTYVKAVEKRRQDAVEASSATRFANAPPQTAAALLRIANDQNGVKFLAEIERNAPGTLAALGADPQTMIDVQVQLALSLENAANFAMDPFFLTRNRQQIDFIKSKVRDDRLSSAVAAMEYTVMQSRSVRVLTPDNLDRLEQAARATNVAGSSDHSVVNHVATSPAANQTSTEGVVLAHIGDFDESRANSLLRSLQDFGAHLEVREKAYYHHVKGDASLEPLKKAVLKRKKENGCSVERVLEIIIRAGPRSQEEMGLLNASSAIQDIDSTPVKRTKWNHALAILNKGNPNQITPFTICDPDEGYDSFDET